MRRAPQSLLAVDLGRHVARRPRTRSRAVAEIECLFCIFILLAILFLTIGLANLGVARIAAVSEAEYQALGNATVGEPPDYTDDADLTEVTTEWDIRPGLPNRTHVSRIEKEVSIYTAGDESVAKTKIHGLAGAISPSWMLNAYPAVDEDGQTTYHWFDDFITESHSELISPLILAPDWLP